MIELTKEIQKKELRNTCRISTPYNPDKELILPQWIEFAASKDEGGIKNNECN